MKVVTKSNVLAQKSFFLDEIKNGKLFVYPTDTIYGIGCNAQLPLPIKALRKSKERPNKPLSIIAPSKARIKKNFSIPDNHLDQLNKLPGRYTFVLNLHNEGCIAATAVNPRETTIGVRIPDNWFTKLITEASIPFVTTSANISGQPHITKIEQLTEQLKTSIDYAIDDGKLNDQPSTVIDLTQKNEKVIRE